MRDAETHETPGPPLATPTDVREFVRRFDAEAFLRQIAFVATREGSTHPLARFFPRSLNTWSLGDLARYVVLEGSDYRRRQATIDDVLHGVNLVNGIAGISRPRGDHRDIYHFLYQTAFKQFAYQFNPAQRLGRLLVMHEDLPQSISRLGTYDLGDHFTKATGITLEQFVWTVFGVWAIANQGIPFTAESIANHGAHQLHDVITPETVSAVLALVSATRGELITAAQAELKGLPPDSRELFAQNPLTVTPVVRLTSGTFVVPQPRFLLRRLLEAPYYVLLKADGEAFTRYYGHVFEEYVGWLLRPYCGERLRGEFEYGSSKARRKSSDWMIDEGDGVALLECKTARLPKAIKTTASYEEVTERYATFYGDAARQLQRVSHDLATEPAFAELRGRQPAPFIVVLDPIYLANSPWSEDARAAASERNALEAEFRPEIMSVDALERLVPALGSLRLHELLRAKREREGPDPPRHWDWEQFAAPYAPPGPNALLESRWDRFVEARMGPK
jgi:hypothetical protein